MYGDYMALTHGVSYTFIKDNISSIAFAYTYDSHGHAYHVSPSSLPVIV
jgi:hypothetical protein